MLSIIAQLSVGKEVKMIFKMDECKEHVSKLGKLDLRVSARRHSLILQPEAGSKERTK